MKLLRKYAPFTVGFMILNLLFVSCGPSATLDATPSAKYSGEEIFRGLFFFQNDIANNIPQLQQVALKINETRAENAEVDQYLQKVADLATDHIKAYYPTYFVELQNAMYSRDYYQIQEKLALSGKLIEQAVLTSEEYAGIYAVGQQIGQDSEMVAKIQALDLTQEADQRKLEKMLATLDDIEQVDSKAAFFAAVVAAVYLLAGAVNTVVAAYYVIAAAAVIVELAVIGTDEIRNLSSGDIGLSDELLVAEISQFFSGE